MRTSNPLAKQGVWTQFGRAEATASSTMTIEGVINKTGFFAILTVLSAGYVWNLFFASLPMGWQLDPMLASAGMQKVFPFVIGGFIGSLIFGLITSFKQQWAMVLGALYSLSEGLLLGGLSAYFEAQYPGIVMQAVFLTFGVFLAMLGAYRVGLVSASGKLAAIVTAGMGAIFLVYIGSFILGMFGVHLPIFGASPIGIAFSVVVVGFAAFSLIFAFDFVESGAKSGAPKFLEWYGAFFIMTQLTWLYLEILRLLWKIQALAGRD